MLNPGRALWYALKVDDFNLAEFLISQNADIRQTYEYQPKKYLSTTSLMVLKACQSRTKGIHSQHYLYIKSILTNFLEKAEECDLRCHCSKNYEHRCPLYIALKTLAITKEEQLSDLKNEIIRILLLKGANLKSQNNPIDVEGYRQYLIQKVNLQKSTQGFKEGNYTFSK